MQIKANQKNLRGVPNSYEVFLGIRAKLLDTAN